MRTAPVSGSISTSHTWQPFGKVTAGGVKAAVSLKPGSRPGGDASAARDDLVAGARDGGAADAERPRAAVAAAGPECVAVAPLHVDAGGRHGERVADDLRERRLVALAHRGGAGEQRDRAVAVDADLRSVRIECG